MIGTLVASRYTVKGNKTRYLIGMVVEEYQATIYPAGDGEVISQTRYVIEWYNVNGAAPQLYRNYTIEAIREYVKILGYATRKNKKSRNAG